VHEIRRINGGNVFQNGRNVFQICRNKFYNQKMKFSSKFQGGERSSIGIIAEFHGISTGTPNQAAKGGNEC
jgi:hypothetical protein